MTEEALLALSIHEVAARVQKGSLPSDAVANASLSKLRRLESGPNKLNALISVRERVEESQRTGPLAGVPVVVKDNIATTEFDTTCGSRLLTGYRSPFDATVVTRLRDAGAIVVGKSNLDEFGMGSRTEHSAFGAAHHPHDHARSPGGSSGGSAAVVGAGAVRVALGSETGGSVRQPAAHCGVVGLKPTYGRVSRYGLVAYASSLDQVGVFGATVDEAATVFGVIAGHDPRDATSVEHPVSIEEPQTRNLVVGWPREYFPESLDGEIRRVCEALRSALEASGVVIREVSLPSTALAIPTYYILAPAEASANLARFDGVRFGVRAEESDLDALYEATRTQGFGEEVRRRILLGTYVLSSGYYDAYYRTALRARARIRRELLALFEGEVDVVLTPTTPSVAPLLGSITDPYEEYLSDIFTVGANLAGIPAISVPAGEVGGLPVGVQLMGPMFSEARLFRVARLIETLRSPQR